MPSYDDEQLRIARAIRRIGRKRGESRKEIVAALETGLVESGLRNLNYGDADSKGWRQERASLYRNPTNVKAGINRFFDETSSMGDGKGITAGELAARVQRPREDLRGKYHERVGEAKSLLRSLDRQGGGAAPQRTLSRVTQPGTPGVTSSQVDLTALLASQLEKPLRAAASTPPPLPEFAAKPVSAVAVPTTSGRPTAASDGTSALDAALGVVRDAELTRTAGTAGTSAPAKQSGKKAAEGGRL